MEALDPGSITKSEKNGITVSNKPDKGKTVWKTKSEDVRRWRATKVLHTKERLILSDHIFGVPINTGSMSQTPQNDRFLLLKKSRPIPQNVKDLFTAVSSACRIRRRIAFHLYQMVRVGR